MANSVLTHALVRPPGASFKTAISSTGAAIDVALARGQHAEYCQALRAAGLEVEALPPDEAHPDSCFMQDPAMVVAGQGIVCRMGAASRRGEEEGAAQALAARGFRLARIQPPGALEGGDVLVLPDRVWVGQSGRSNAAGIAQLGALLEPAGLPVAGIPVAGFLHLLSAVTHVGRGTLLVVAEFAQHPAFAGIDKIIVSAADAYAVNALSTGETVILPAGYPRVAAALVSRGFEVLAVPTSEFAKADGGVTCLSLAW